jgi:hypothetical protein
MKDLGQRKRLAAAAAMAGVLLGVCSCATLQTADTVQQPVAATAQGKQQAPAPAAAPGLFVNVPYIPAPNSIDLCGEPVPLQRQDVYERFDKEFTLIVYNHAQVYLWLKRMERYFPVIEERLRYYNLPDDLKYVAIVESDLLPNACSPKGAAGPWQFMPSTGSAYGLDQRGSVDKRYDFERSTDSAFLLLNDLYRKYNSWSLAIAAYNCGDRRILEQSRVQGVRDYYDMKLPQETERYVFRILAVKAVLSNPNQYGYDLPKGWGYQEVKFDRVSVSLSSLNPVFRSDDIPAGNHEIKLPLGTGKAFELNFRYANSAPAGTASPESSTAERPDDVPFPAATAVTAAPAAKAGSARPPQKTREKIYQVKKGDTLSAIAQRHNLSAHELKAANKLKSDDLTPGQKLRIP